jgi:hypothetical protein
MAAPVGPIVGPWRSCQTAGTPRDLTVNGPDPGILKATIMKIIIATAFALTAAAGAARADCPDYTQWGATYAATGDDLWVPQSWHVTAGGANALTQCPRVQYAAYGDEGYFTTAPDFTFDLQGMEGYLLEVRVVSDCDAALLVNDARGTWFYDDDTNGNLDPKVVLHHPGNGYLDVWVGSYDGQYCDATLTLETFAG